MAAHTNAVARPRSSERASDPATPVQMVRRSAATYEGGAMRFWQEGRWRDLSYGELGRAAFEIAGGPISLGVHPGDRVSILAGTRAEWTLADLGALCAGAVVAPIYHTNSPEECCYILEHAGSRVVFCDGTDQLAKVTQVRADCPLLEHVITYIRIRQGHSSDRELLLRGFERLSPESRYRRFLAPMPELSEATVRYLTEIDHHDHEAMIALDEATGEGIGVARYVRDVEWPTTAEVAVTVIDDWQRLGVGGLLLEVLSARAREEGIDTFTALMLATNRKTMVLLKTLDPMTVVDREKGMVEIEVPIPKLGLAPALRKLIRIAAQHDVAVPPDHNNRMRLANRARD
jgi:GNAT superfamily N-acetyltransferase